MNHHLKALLCMLSVILTGCNLDIYFVGEGHVTSTNGRVDCAQPCKWVTTSFTTVYLNAEPAPGYSFLGFTGSVMRNVGGGYPFLGRENVEVTYGAGLMSLPGSIIIGPTFPTWVEQSAGVTALFWPANDITQTLTAANNICLIDLTNTLHCWGINGWRFPTEGALKLVTESFGYTYDLCVLYSDSLVCRYQGTSDWFIPDSITQPIDAALSSGKLCVLHGTLHGNAVYCATQRGQQVIEVPALSNPINLHVSDAGQFCVEDEGQAVCW